VLINSRDRKDHVPLPVTATQGMPERSEKFRDLIE